ncbi:hypothetical protein BGZ83_008018 [Gryganskiella cystojenkinii]|nr:hypothetical protein BGZ83_008018 [Gryganskiella cystojenkinii]
MPPKKRAATKKSKAAASAAAAAAEMETNIAHDEAVPAEEIVETLTTTTTTTITTIDTTTTSEQEVEQEQETKKATTSKKSALKRKATADQDTESASTSADQDQEMQSASSTSAKPTASKDANRKDLMDEHQKTRSNPREELKKEKAREEAQKLIEKRDLEEAGKDYERSQYWGYSAESVERWNEKQEAKKNRMDNKFTDWDQMNHKKYLKQVGELKPNLTAYNAKKEAAMHTNEDGELVVSADSGFYRDANSVEFLSDAKPNALAIDRLAADVAKQIDARSRFSKRRAHKEDADVNYINDANQKFNQKIARFYDKYTKDIRDNFERGTNT